MNYFPQTGMIIGLPVDLTLFDKLYWISFRK